MDSKRCITIDEISTTASSNSHGSVRRCRDTDVTISGSGKRRKFDSLDQEIPVPSENHFQSEFDVKSPEDIVSSAESGACDHVSSSPCLNNGLSLDLKTELRFETETSMSGDDSFSRETSPSSEICLDSDKTESFPMIKRNPTPPQTVVSDHRPVTVAKFPTETEIEEFFSAAEKKEQKRFSEKYNFDIVNDVPMDGRYQWVELTP